MMQCVPKGGAALDASENIFLLKSSLSHEHIWMVNTPYSGSTEFDISG